MKVFLQLPSKKKILPLVFFFFAVIFSRYFAQTNSLVKDHYSSKNVQLFDKKMYDLSGFEKRTKQNVSLETLKLIDEAYLSHPDLGVSVHPFYKDAIELVDKRDIYHSTYVLPDGKTIFSSSAQPLNYVDKDGWYREIIYELDEKPVINDVFKASNQAIPKAIDRSTGRTTFETPLGDISINQQSKVKFINGIDEIGSVYSLNNSQSEIGKNGLFVQNAFPDIDMQVILMKNGYVKTNYIIKNRSTINPASEFMVFEDIVTLPKGLRFDFDTEKGINTGIEEDWEGSLVVRNEKNEDIFHYMIPFIYDNDYTTAMMNAPLSTYSQATESFEEQGVESTSFLNSSYRVEKISETSYKVSVVVKTEWLLSDERQYPIVVDPTTFTGATLTFTAGNFCARRVSGSLPVDNPGPAGVGCYASTCVLPAGYMLVSSMPVRVFAGYKTRGCAASSTWMKYYGPCGYEPVASGFFYFCNTNLTNVDCGAPAGGTSLNDLLSRCSTTGGGELCATAKPPSCANQTLNFSVCYQTRCSANAAGTCATTSTSFPNGANASYVEAGVADFRVDIIGEKIAITLSGNPASGSNVCPSINVPLTLGTRFGVPNALSTANCTDQMGGTYSWTASCTGGSLSSTSGTTSTTGTFAAAVNWNSGAVPGTYTISVTVCNTNCPAPAGTMCDTKTLTYTVGDAIAPVVSDVDACNGVAVSPVISNPQGGYTYTWYTNAAGTAGATNGATKSYPAVNGTTQTYSVRATSPCASTLTTFTITWGPLSDPVVSGDTKCPGQAATLTADCGANCRWYTVPAGGAALTTSGSLTVGNGTLDVDPVAAAVTYYVENFVSAGCISARVPVTISTNALTVTTNPASVNPICPSSTADFSTSISGNTNTGSSAASAAGPNTMEDGSACTGPDCTTANAALLDVTTPANATEIQSVCFQMNGSAWCGKETKFYLRSPDGTVFTLYGGRTKNDKTQNATGNFCFNDLASATVTAPTMGAGIKISDGTYLADGGALATAFASGAPNFTAGSTWSVFAVDDVAGSCGSGTATISNVVVTFGVTSPPVYSWSGGPAGGSLSNSNIANPVFTPPLTGGAFNSNYTVTVTDAVGCTGSAIVNVVCAINLPIEILSFYGDVGDRDNHLFWNSVAETNSDFIEIERSGDDVNFKKIGKVKAAGNSFSLKEYTFDDQQRLIGKNYYRLKLVDLNGDYKYSNTILLETKNKEISLEVLPNPASSYVDILYQMNFSADSELKIYDTKGGLIDRFEIKSEKGINSHKVNIENYSKGVYSIVLINEGVVSTSRFVKQ